MSGVAVYDTLTEIGLRPDIKWPNDVLVGEKKICGILAEMCESRKGLAVVVGIGINLTSKNFPPELVDAATSIEAELGRSAAVSDLELALLKYFEYFYRRLCDVDGPTETLTEWERRSSYGNGRRVRVTLENGSITGVTDGLESNGALRVRSGDASVVVVQAGDVQRLRDGID
jgi:BirA family biotin operon repressor/biotin-[acetyl-CoA-carboxylase] ligase